MNAAVFCLVILAGADRPALFAEPARPAMFAAVERLPPACQCFHCECTKPCKCSEADPAHCVIGCVPLARETDGRVVSVGITDYRTARALALEEGRPLVCLIGAEAKAKAGNLADQSAVIYAATTDPLFPRAGVWRYEPRTVEGKAGLYQTHAPPRCANGKCSLR